MLKKGNERYDISYFHDQVVFEKQQWLELFQNNYELDGTMITCSECGHLNDSSRVTCEECGSDLSDSPDYDANDDLNFDYSEDRGYYDDDYFD